MEPKVTLYFSCSYLSGVLLAIGKISSLGQPTHTFSFRFRSKASLQHTFRSTPQASHGPCEVLLGIMVQRFCHLNKCNIWVLSQARL